MRTEPLALVLLLLAAPAGAAMTVQASHKGDIDYAAYSSYVWRSQGYPGDHPLADNSPLDRKLKAIADEILAGKGFKRGDDDAQLELTYTGVVRDQLEITGSRYKIAGNVSWIGDPNAHATRWAQEGTLAIHIIDAETDEVVWTGWATDVAYSPDKMRKKAEKAVRRILKLFPPR